MVRARGRIWAGTLLLAVVSQFAGPLSGAATAVVGPVALPFVEQQSAEPSDSAAEPGTVGVAAEPTDCPTEPPEVGTTCAAVGEVVGPVDGLPCDASNPTACAPPAGEDPCDDGDLACAVTAVRDEHCDEDDEAGHCTALDLIVNCLDADACAAGDVVASAAGPVCEAVAPNDAATCEQELQDCADAQSTACERALDYLRDLAREATCSPEEPVCAQVWELLDCQDDPACAFQAVWDEATPTVCDLVGGESEEDQSRCGDELGACDDPVAGVGGCGDAAEYLMSRMDAAACGSTDECVRQAVTTCAGEPNSDGCDNAVFAAAVNALCTSAPCGGAAEPLKSLSNCIDWDAEAGAPVPKPICVETALIDAVCSVVVDPCLLESDAVVELLGVRDQCMRNPTGDPEVGPTCEQGIRSLAVGALCTGEDGPTCIEGLEDCEGQACALALWDGACGDGGGQPGAAACPNPVRELRECVDPATSATCQQPGFWVKWIGRACAGTAAASTACPTEAIVSPPMTVAGPDGTPTEVPLSSTFENGSAQFPYRSIKAAIDAVAMAAQASGNVKSPAIKGPIRVNPGTYKEPLDVTTANALSTDLVIQRTGDKNQSAKFFPASGAGLRLDPRHRLVLGRALNGQGQRVDNGMFEILATPQFVGPQVTTSVTVDRSRMYVGHGAGVETVFGVTEVALPEQVRYQLALDGPGVSKDTVSVQTWDGTAWTDLAFDPASATPTVELFASAPDAAVAVPLNRSASVRVVGTSTMGLTMTGRLVGVMTQVVYASDTTDYIEVAEVPDGPVAPPAKPRTEADDTPPLVRLSGEDRAATAAAVSRSSFPDGADAVFVATGASYADALAGGPAAAKTGSPVVLVERDRVPEATRTELERLDPARVRLLGGTGAISAEVEEELAAMGTEVSRLRGASRYATAAAVSAAHFEAGVPVAYVASGEGFADALSGGAAAAALGGPVLLVQPDAVPSATEQELRRLAPGRIVVLGGTSAVSDAVVAELRAHSDEVRRVSGADRYATSAAVSRDAFSGTHETVFVATGATFADALAGVPAAGALGAPLMLVEPDRLPAEVAAELDRLRPKRIVILGGERSVSQRLERELRSYQIP